MLREELPSAINLPQSDVHKWRVLRLCTDQVTSVAFMLAQEEPSVSILAWCFDTAHAHCVLQWEATSFFIQNVFLCTGIQVSRCLNILISLTHFLLLCSFSSHHVSSLTLLVTQDWSFLFCLLGISFCDLLKVVSNTSRFLSFDTHTHTHTRTPFRKFPWRWDILSFFWMLGVSKSSCALRTKRYWIL